MVDHYVSNEHYDPGDVIIHLLCKNKICFFQPKNTTLFSACATLSITCLFFVFTITMLILAYIRITANTSELQGYKEEACVVSIHVCVGEDKS